MIEMDYEDANGETLTASRTIPLWTSAVRLGVKTDGWLMKQDDLRLRFVAVDTVGQADRGPQDQRRTLQQGNPDRAAAADRRLLRL